MDVKLLALLDHQQVSSSNLLSFAHHREPLNEEVYDFPTHESAPPRDLRTRAFSIYEFFSVDVEFSFLFPAEPKK